MIEQEDTKNNSYEASKSRFVDTSTKQMAFPTKFGWSRVNREGRVYNISNATEAATIRDGVLKIRSTAEVATTKEGVFGKRSATEAAGVVVKPHKPINVDISFIQETLPEKHEKIEEKYLTIKKKSIEYLSERLIEQGYSIKVFQEPLIDVLNALIKHEPIGKLDLTDTIQNEPDFRFMCFDSPEVSLLVSSALAEQIQLSTLTLRQHISRKGSQKITGNADDFARRMHEVIKDLQTNEKVSSFRETVKVLNDNHIPTYRGGEWHVKTLQNLNKRWQELGIISPPKPK